MLEVCSANRSAATVAIVLDMVLGHADRMNTCHTVQADLNAVDPLLWASSEACLMMVWQQSFYLSTEL